MPKQREPASHALAKRNRREGRCALVGACGRRPFLCACRGQFAAGLAAYDERREKQLHGSRCATRTAGLCALLSVQREAGTHTAELAAHRCNLLLTQAAELEAEPAREVKGASKKIALLEAEHGTAPVDEVLKG